MRRDAVSRQSKWRLPPAATTNRLRHLQSDLPRCIYNTNEKIVTRGVQSTYLVGIFQIKKTISITHLSIQSMYEYSTMVGYWYVPGTHVDYWDTKHVQKIKKISRIKYTRNHRPGTNHPHFVGTDAAYFLPRPMHLTEVLQRRTLQQHRACSSTCCCCCSYCRRYSSTRRWWSTGSHPT